MPVSRPGTLYRWATAVGALITAPSSGRQDTGWVAEEPPADIWNAVWLNTYQWLAYLQDLANQSMTWAAGATQTFAGPAIFTGAITLPAPTPHYVGAGGGEPAFAGSWANIPASSAVKAHFYQDAQGVVHLGGAATGGSGTVFTLPAGYRPLGTRYFSYAYDSAGVAKVAQITINTSGVVTFADDGPSGIAVLDGINFHPGIAHG